MKNLITLLAIIFLSSCSKILPYNNIIRINNTCYKGDSYLVDYELVTYNEGYPVIVMFIKGFDTLDYQRFDTVGLGKHQIKLSTGSNGCQGVVKIVNGDNYYSVFASCNQCEPLKWPWWK